MTSSLGPSSVEEPLQLADKMEIKSKRVFDKLSRRRFH